MPKGTQLISRTVSQNPGLMTHGPLVYFLHYFSSLIKTTVCANPSFVNKGGVINHGSLNHNIKGLMIQLNAEKILVLNYQNNGCGSEAELSAGY